MRGSLAGRVAALLGRARVGRPGVRGLSPRDQSGGHCVRPPLRCPLVRLVPPPRPVWTGGLDSRMQGYLPSPPLRMPVSSVSVPWVWGRCAKLPNCYGRVRQG
ncbi:hypothetical protein G6W55_23895 [Streptomyces sp. CAI-85]|nr:hypothetical protein [Streptomyces sp. CAI-85]